MPSMPGLPRVPEMPSVPKCPDARLPSLGRVLQPGRVATIGILYHHDRYYNHYYKHYY